MEVVESTTYTCKCNGKCKVCKCALDGKREESKEEKIERVRDNFMDSFMKVE